MHFDDYQSLVVPLEKTATEDYLARLDHGAIGLITEAGEIWDILKKDWIYGKEMDRKHFVEELGDVTWYAALIGNALNIKLSNVFPQAREGLSQSFAQFGQEPTQDELDDLCTLLVTCASSAKIVVNEMRARRCFALDEVVNTAAAIVIVVERIAERFFQTPMSIVLGANIAKLSKRYPAGFTAHHAIVRNLEEEMKAFDAATGGVVGHA